MQFVWPCCCCYCLALLLLLLLTLLLLLLFGLVVAVIVFGLVVSVIVLFLLCCGCAEACDVKGYVVSDQECYYLASYPYTV